MRTIALALGLSKPVTKLDVVRYMYGRPVDFTPGTANHYSNFGYLLAGAVFEHVSGMAYAAYVNKTLLQPAGINEVQVISTLASLRSSNEAIAEDQGLGLSPLNLTSQLLVPSVYGGDGEINEVGDPNDGMGASAEAMTQFIHLHAGLGQRAASQRGRPRGQHAGRIHLGGVAWCGVDWACVINTRDRPPATAATNQGRCSRASTRC